LHQRIGADDHDNYGDQRKRPYFPHP
jgi:hypothetical protein